MKSYPIIPFYYSLLCVMTSKENSNWHGESLKTTIWKLFSGIVSWMDDEKLKELQWIWVTEFKEYKWLDDWFYGVLYPIEKLVTWYLLIWKVEDKRQFLFENIKFIEHHLDKIISMTDWRACSHDKTSYITNSLLLISKWIEVDFEIGDKCFWICRKPLLNTEEKVVEFYNAIQQLYYGNLSKYLERYKENVVPNLQGKSE